MYCQSYKMTSVHLTNCITNDKSKWKKKCVLTMKLDNAIKAVTKYPKQKQLWECSIVTIVLWLTEYKQPHDTALSFWRLTFTIYGDRAKFLWSLSLTFRQIRTPLHLHTPSRNRSDKCTKSAGKGNSRIFLAFRTILHWRMPPQEGCTTFYP